MSCFISESRDSETNEYAGGQNRIETNQKREEKKVMIWSSPGVRYHNHRDAQLLFNTDVNGVMH